MEEVKAVLGQYPERAVVDGGFTHQGSIVAMQEQGIDLYGSLPTVAAQQAGA